MHGAGPPCLSKDPLAPLNLAPLLSLLRVLPFFTPPSVRNKVTHYLQGESGCHYTLEAIVSILAKGMRPGTKKTAGDIETTYDWPLNWEIPDFTSDLCKGLSTHHPEIFQLLTSLGRRFIAKFLIALLAEDGHFITLLLDLLAYGRTKTSNSPDLAAYGRTDTSNSPDLPAYGRTVRQTYVRPAGPPCLWPDRPPALQLTKLLNGGKGCSRRKHGYRKESGSRALLAFPFPLALYARVLSKPG